MLSNREKESFRFLSMDSCYSYYIFGRNRIFMIIKAPIHFEYRSRDCPLAAIACLSSCLSSGHYFKVNIYLLF